jgi:uncharacterized protein (TIGR02453 family)
VKTHPLDEKSFPPFAGFPREGLRFLSRLRKNNNRPWFRSHKDEYEQYVRFPMQCLIASLAETMESVTGEIEFNPLRSMFRIYRDVRFSRNKSPYKTHVAAAFNLKGRKGPVEVPGFYLHIEPGGVFVGGGVYMPTSDQLKAFRKSIAEDPSAFLEVVRNRSFVRAYGTIQGEKLQRSPLGFPRDHPMTEYLRYKQFYVGTDLEEKACLSPRFVKTVARLYTVGLPFVRWLARAG